MAGDDDKPPKPGHEATIIAPGIGLPGGDAVESRPRDEGTAATGGSLSGGTSAPAFVTPGSAAGYRPIRAGDVLNHIFEVKRFIARGGMGEVFEGINVNTDERVAIKVILPQLAADPNVQAMFRKEARTLTRLGHPALVQYRVLAQEPTFGVLYIVTEYVDGRNLSDLITKIEATSEDLVDLIRRLAEGLQAAHALGAIHRDMSPDNVMLEGGALAGARIIDFGIAKDLDPGSATIIGTGFAGKLNYVAPEQLGDFGREVGPWTDVYSLALVILAIASRKDVDMGKTMVDAVDKRRAGPDLSAAPEELRPLLARMLEPDPKARIRSMGELLGQLPSFGGTGQTMLTTAPADLPPPVAAEPPSLPPPMPATTPPSPPAEPDPVPPLHVSRAPEPAAPEPIPAFLSKSPTSASPSSAPPAVAATKTKGKTPLIVGGAVAALLVAAGLGYVFLGKGSGPPPAVPVAQVADRSGATRTALTAALPSIGCTWLDVAQVRREGNGTFVSLRGVAGKPDDARGQIARMLAAKSLGGATIDMRDVATIEASECGPLDALRQIRDSASQRMTIAQPQVEMAKQTSGNLAGTVGATAVVDFDLGDSGQEIALFGVEPSGKISQLTSERAELAGVSTDMGGNRYRLPIDVNHPGWSGLVLLTGQTPFDDSLLAGEPGTRTDDWSQRFLAAAQARGWKAEMVWFNAVNQQPD